MESIVIIGASHASVDAITALRKGGWEGSITLIGDEAELPYQRPPLSKGYFSGAVQSIKLAIRPDAFYDNNKVDVRLGVRADAIDRNAKSITLSDGSEVPYSYLIIATGTRARHLNLEGADCPEINYLRTKADVDRIKSLAVEGSKLLIVGAGYIGLELASAAVKQGVEVTVLEAMDRVLARVTCPQVSEFYQHVHAQEGVQVRLNTQLQKFTNENGQYSAIVNDGEEILFDSAVIGIGVIPNSELAEQAGLSCDNGIIVNEFTQTDDPTIFAIGDCSNHPNLFYNKRVRLESVPNAVEQAKIAASVICGTPKVYDALPWFWSDQYDIKLQTAGLFNDYDQVVVRGESASRKFTVFYLQDAYLIAADAINSPADFMMSKKLILNRVRPNIEQLADPEVAIKSLLES